MNILNVIARNPGHYEERHRRAGEIFTLRARGDFADNWMEAVDWDPKAEPTEPAPPPAPEPAPTAGKPGRPPKAAPAEPAET